MIRDEPWATKLLLNVTSNLERGSRLIVGVLITATLIAGCAFSYTRGDQLPYIDEVDYQHIAENLVRTGFYSNDGIEPNADRAPVLPFAMAALHACGAGVFQWRIMNYVFYCLTLWVLYLLVSNHRGERRRLYRFAGALAVILASAYPVLFYSASTLFPQTIGAFLFVLILFLLQGASGNIWRWSVIGCVFGVLLLTIPMFLFTLPVVSAWILANHRREGIRAMFAMLTSCAVVVSIWTIRNYVVFAVFIPLTTSSGAALLWGNSPDATIGGAEVEYLQRAYEKSGKLNQAETDRLLQRFAIEQMQGRKLAVLGFYFLKVLNHFSFVNDHYAKSEVSIWKTVVMAITYLPLLAVLLVRLALYKRYPLSSFEFLLIAIYIFAAFSYAIFHTRIRYRLPYDYALISTIAIFMTDWIDKKTNGNA